jgi:hypothetical protein
VQATSTRPVGVHLDDFKGATINSGNLSPDWMCRVGDSLACGWTSCYPCGRTNSMLLQAGLAATATVSYGMSKHFAAN